MDNRSGTMWQACQRRQAPTKTIDARHRKRVRRPRTPDIKRFLGNLLPTLFAVHPQSLASRKRPSGKVAELPKFSLRVRPSSGLAAPRSAKPAASGRATAPRRQRQTCFLSPSEMVSRRSICSRSFSGISGHRTASAGRRRCQPCGVIVIHRAGNCRQRRQVCQAHVKAIPCADGPCAPCRADAAVTHAHEGPSTGFALERGSRKTTQANGVRGDIGTTAAWTSGDD